VPSTTSSRHAKADTSSTAPASGPWSHPTTPPPRAGPTEPERWPRLRDGGFDAVAAINCLYFLGDPVEGVREASRMLRPGGLFLAGAPSRYHDPELAEVVPGWGEASPFDTEDAEVIVSAVFDDVEAEWWKVPAYRLPDRAAVVDYLVAFEVPDAEDRAAAVPVPTQITKSGVNILARNRTQPARMPG
jgi:SAM-dependent methyltransferase